MKHRCIACSKVLVSIFIASFSIIPASSLFCQDGVQVQALKSFRITPTPAAMNFWVGGVYNPNLDRYIVFFEEITYSSAGRTQKIYSLPLKPSGKKAGGLYPVRATQKYEEFFPYTAVTMNEKENISNRILPLEAKLYFEDDEGHKISNEVIIHANKKVESAQEREFKEKFTLRNKKYSKSKKYYLVMENMENNTEIKSYEFIIDIAISDDFDF